MSDGEKREEVDKLPTRYMVDGLSHRFESFESSTASKRVLCPVYCVALVHEGKLRAANVFQGRKNNLVAQAGRALQA
ncbi:hypothetical protein T492DRAFT_896475 [Pavlovales sp. CCMP2436]|nr:hypothetical protein T492DRAFT_896475 [Pavlovales sp. CCMP2436]